MTASEKKDQAHVERMMSILMHTLTAFSQPSTARSDENGRLQLLGMPRYYAESLLAGGKLGGIKEAGALVRQCIAWARERAAHYGDTPPGTALRQLADLFERHPTEAVNYVRDWEADVNSRIGDAS
jgi:hypothetical protein